eukprot:TRINITY_DN4933_c0_g1_i1.p1 TRINITY_DN4933_c0_g1~~TRINITY_DN4933_c0_g1_i1.p1  ORF type:complete len:737 (+),score=182.10 TRINITY_DN4933_c0_g1_i1:263-2473(+)
MKQIRENKRAMVIEKRRLLGGIEGPPKICGIIQLGSNANPAKALELLQSGCGEDAFVTPSRGGFLASIPQHKIRLHFCGVGNDLNAILDLAKVCDVILFLVNGEEGVPVVGGRILSLLRAQGMPSAMVLLQGLDTLAAAKKQEIKRYQQRYFSTEFKEEPRILPIDTVEEAAQAIRFISIQKVQPINWRDMRAYMLATNAEFIRTSEEPDALGTFVISGYLRGNLLSANDLMHIPDFGDFQLIKIQSASDPCTAKRRQQISDLENDAQLLEEADPEKRESLESVVVPDFMSNEQTWPTDEDFRLAQKEKVKRKVPKGTSDYQATWIVDSDEGEDDDSENGSMHSADEDSDEEDNDAGPSNAGDEDIEFAPPPVEFKSPFLPLASHLPKAPTAPSMRDDDSVFDFQIADDPEDEEERARVLKAYKESLDDMEFPDEVDTPLDQPARERFARYRGLKHIKQSSWDPKESLPIDYARIFQFGNFTRTMKKVLSEKSGVQSGIFVQVFVSNVPPSVMTQYVPDRPLVVGGLLKYENKMSVINFAIQKYITCEDMIKTKESLIFHYGFRRYQARPVFSENTQGIDKHKMEKFLQHGRFSVATIYAPICFPPASVLIFRGSSDPTHIVATGTLLSVDPDRIVLKRIILSGFPFKVHKKTCVVRYMFFNPEDIRWFRPVELWTKYGRIGHIREPLGTHGHMKCIFDGVVTMQDTICMSLYKRVFPKWPVVEVPAEDSAHGDMN